MYEVCYFQLDDPQGYVKHGPITKIKEAFLISYGPLIQNSILCMQLTFPMVFPYMILDAYYSGMVFEFLGWAGFTIGMYAIPSDTDAAGFVFVADTKDNKLWVYLLAVPLYWLVRLLNSILSRFWFNLIYAVGISTILSKMFLNVWVWMTL